MRSLIAPFTGLFALCLILGGCTDSQINADAPPGHARLDTGLSQTGESSRAASGGAAAVGATPSGAIATVPTH